MTKLVTFCLVATALILSGADALAQIVERKVSLYSEGTRLSGTVFYLQPLDGQKLPTIILSHGWGGTASMLRPQAERFANAGYFVLTVDYRGWGDSDSRLVRDESAGAQQGNRALREVVHPLDQATDISNAVHWVMGEPMVDSNRVGLWGTSFSGGLVVYVAARDPRIKATVSQVAWFGTPRSQMPPAALSKAESDATRRARGEIGYPVPGVQEVGNLRGGPVREAFLHYAPIEDISTIKGCAMLIIDAEKEELFDIRTQGELAYRRAPDPKKRVVIPGVTHYDVYGKSQEQATTLAIEWMDNYLKATRNDLDK